MHPPTSTSYLIGSVLGSLAGAAALVAFTFVWLQPERGEFAAYLAFVPFLGIFLLGVFLVVGWPLFLVVRSTRWFRASLMALVGALAGVAASGVFGGIELNLVSLAFAASGSLAASICWWFMAVSPNPSINTDASDKAAGAGYVKR